MTLNCKRSLRVSAKLSHAAVFGCQLELQPSMPVSISAEAGILLSQNLCKSGNATYVNPVVKAMQIR